MPPLFVVAAVVFLEIVCLGAVIPALTPFTESLGGTALIAGVMFALVSGPKIFMNPIWGRAADRLGRRPIFLLLTSATLGSSLLWAFTEDLAAATGIAALLWLGLSRLIHGIFSAQATVAFAVASDTSTPDKRAGVLGVLGAAFGAGLTVGFPLGGVVAATSFANVGLLCAACEAIALVLLIFGLRETGTRAPVPLPSPPLEGEGVEPPLPSRQGPGEGQTETPMATTALHQHRRLIPLALVCIITTVGLSMMTPTFSPLLRDAHAFSVKQIGWAFFVFGIVSIIVQGGLIRPFVKRLGEPATFIFGTLVLVVGFALVALETALPGLWVGTLLIGAGAGFSTPTLAAMFSLSVRPEDQGATHGLNQGCTALGRTLSYPAAGALYEQAIALPYWAGAALLLIGLVPLAWFGQRK